MKKTLFLLLALSTMLANAQGRRNNQSFIYGEYGYSPEKGDLKAGYMAKAGYGRVFGNKGLLGKAEAFYQNYEVSYIDKQVLPYQKYGVNINAGFSYEGLYPVMLNIWAGGYGAYESANDGNQTDPKYNAEIPTKVKGFVYGISGSAEAEIFIVRRLSFTANYTQLYDLKSKFSKSNYALSGGLRFYIN